MPNLSDKMFQSVANRKFQGGTKKMSVAKNIEITSTSKVSFEDAVKRGIERASESLNNVRGAWIKEQKVRIDGGKVSEYEVMMIITFVLDGSGGGADEDSKANSNAKGKSKKK